MNVKKLLALLALVVVLGLVNWSIAGKESHLANGRVVYLELAPIDPRSLMQGDYMALNFQMANQIRSVLPKTNRRQGWRREIDAEDGNALVNLDDLRKANFEAIYDQQSLKENQLLLRYRIRDGKVKFATNAFFFQEGHAKRYEAARFGLFRVDDHGELLLVSMHDEELANLAQEPTSDLTNDLAD